MPRLFLIWWLIQPKVLAPGFASGNGRIEGTKIDVAPKIAGRLTQIFVNEGDFVKSGQIVAHMATTALLAQRDQVTTDLDQAENVIAVDESLVGARQADRTAADPVVDQHKADSMVAEQQLGRTTALEKEGWTQQRPESLMFRLRAFAPRVKARASSSRPLQSILAARATPLVISAQTVHCKVTATPNSSVFQSRSSEEMLMTGLPS